MIVRSGKSRSKGVVKVTIRAIRRHIGTGSATPPDTVLIPTILKSIDGRTKQTQFTIDGLKKSNNQAMEDILTVLQESVEDTRRNHTDFNISPILIKLSRFNQAMKHHNSQYLSAFANEFGFKIVNVVLFRLFNRLGIYHNHPEYLQSDKNNFIRNDLIDKYVESMGNMVNSNEQKSLRLNWQQSIVKSFEFDIKTCLNNVMDEFRTKVIPQVFPTEGSIDTYHGWNLPTMDILDIDQVYKRVYFRDDWHFTKRDLLSLSWIKSNSTDMEQDQTNLLSYLEMEDRVIWRLIELKQLELNLKITESLKLMRLMKLYELEGQFMFDIMMKRILLKIIDTKLTEDGELKPEYQDPILMLNKNESVTTSFFDSNDIITKNGNNTSNTTTSKKVRKSPQQYWQSGGIGKTNNQNPHKRPVMDNMDEINITKFDYGILDDEFILNNFIENSTNLNKFKIIVVFKAKLYHRIKNDDYIMALSACANRYKTITEEEIKLKLISYFDRYWRLISNTEPYLSYVWMIEVFNHLNHNRGVINDDTVQLAIEDYKLMIKESIEIGQQKVTPGSTTSNRNTNNSEGANPGDTPVDIIFDSIKKIKHGYRGNARYNTNPNSRFNRGSRNKGGK